jgi:hypothetical protein
MSNLEGASTNRSLEEKDNDIDMVVHHISHFILNSRLDDKYELEQIEKATEYINKLKQLLHSPEELQKLDEFTTKVNSVDLNSPKDNRLLDELDRLLETNIKILKLRT